MKRSIALATAILCAPLATASAAPFVNLDFEQATIQPAPTPHVPSDAFNPISAASALPGWTAQEDSTFVNALWSGPQVLDETSIYLINPATSSYTPIAGNYSLELYGVALFGPPYFKTASISQTGDIPAGVHSIQMLAFGNFSSSPQTGQPPNTPFVTLNGTAVPMSILSVSGNVATLGGDITPFAGTTATLAITAAGTSTSLSDIEHSENFSIFDNITFSATIVPEPSTITLLALGAIGLAVARRRFSV